MQAEESASARGRAEAAPSSPRLSPIKAFALVLILLAVAGGIFVLTRPPEVPPTNINPQPADYSLTDAEAITRFHELNDLRLQVLRQRDDSLLPMAFTPNSPAARRIGRSLGKLRRDNVLFRSVESTEKIRVIRNTSMEIELRQKVLVRPHFVSESGRDVTTGRKEQQTIEWTLRRAGTTWLIHDGLVVAVSDRR